MAARSNRPPSLELPATWASASRSISAAWITKARVGELVSGDAVVVRPRPDGVLIALIDALGHGPNAAKVAEAALAWLASVPEDGRVHDIVQGLHQALQGTRGAAGLLLTASATGIEACSVGNVELRSMSGKLPFVLTPGVLGLRLRQPRTCVIPLPLVDRFVLFSDGISSRFELKARAADTPSELSSFLFAKHRHAHDDATVIVLDVAL